MSKVKEEAVVQLERSLNLGDLILFNVVAVIGLTWLSTAAKAGPGGLTLWVLAALFFFIPQGIAITVLSSHYPDEGGIYAWAKREFGATHGFICGWCYWINNVLFYPSLLISTAVIAIFAIGKGDSGVGDNRAFILLFTLSALLLATVLNIVGVKTGKWLQNIGGLGVFLPGLLLIFLGVYAFFTRPSANPITMGSWMPSVTGFSSLNLWATIPFAYSGLELSATMAGEVHKPSINLPRSIYFSAPLIAALYILGTGALLWLVPIPQIQVIPGPFQAIAAATGGKGLFGWLVPVAAASITISRLGGLGAWLSGPARVAFVVGVDRYFPPVFGRIHPRWRTPYVAILVQTAVIAMVMIFSMLGKGTTIESAFLLLVDMSLLIYFIPYIYLFICLIKYCGQAQRQQIDLPAGRFGTLIMGICGLVVTVFAMVVATIPPPDTNERILSLIKVLGGAGFFLLLGGGIYALAMFKMREKG